MFGRHIMKNIIDILDCRNILGNNISEIMNIGKNIGIAKPTVECRVICKMEDKDFYIFYFLQFYAGKTIIFCKTVTSATRLAQLLNLLGFGSSLLHSFTTERDRAKDLRKFSLDENGVLVVTDSVSRHLIIPYVDLIIHYHTPKTTKLYMERVGPVIRLASEGITVMLMEPSEARFVDMFMLYDKSERMPEFPIEDDFLQIMKNRVNLARDILKLRQQLNKVPEDYSTILQNPEVEKQIKLAQSSLNLKYKQLEVLLNKKVFVKCKKRHK